MKYDFLPKSIRDKLPPLYAQEKVKDPMVHVKFFTPWSNWTWYATEFDGKDTFFGWVVGFEKELGYFSLSEMQTARGPMGLKIERDIYFAPKPLSEVMAVYGERMPSVTRYPAVVRKDRELPRKPICPACGGPLMYMGTLGRKEWYRCRNCGAEFHKDPSRKPTEYMPAVAPQTEGPQTEAFCPACGGPGGSMGVLGRKEWYRCRNCGMEWSSDVARRRSPQTEGSMKTPEPQHRFALYKCWLDSRGEEGKVKVKQGTFADLNRWAKAEGLTFKSDSSLFGGYYLGPADEWYIADIIFGLHLGGPTKLAAPQTGAPRELPVFKGYTVDHRLRQFRKAEPGKSLEFIDFDSPKGQALLTEMAKGSKVQKIDARGWPGNKVRQLIDQYPPHLYKSHSWDHYHKSTTAADITSAYAFATREGATVMIIQEYGCTAFIPIHPGRVPQTGSAYASPERKLLGQLERARREDPDQFYRLEKQVRQEIKNRERGKIKMFPDIGLVDLRNILKQAERMYR